MDLFTADQYQTIKSVFQSYDEDHDGILKSEEFESAFRALGMNPSPEEVLDMLNDANGDINFDAFIYLLYYHSRSANVIEELIDSFQIFDKNGKGTLPIETVKKILKSVRKPFTDEQIDDVLKKLQIEQGSVNYEELANQLISG